MQLYKYMPHLYTNIKIILEFGTFMIMYFIKTRFISLPKYQYRLQEQYGVFVATEENTNPNCFCASCKLAFSSFNLKFFSIDI